MRNIPCGCVGIRITTTQEWKLANKYQCNKSRTCADYPSDFDFSLPYVNGLTENAVEENERADVVGNARGWLIESKEKKLILMHIVLDNAM